MFAVVETILSDLKLVWHDSRSLLNAPRQWTRKAQLAALVFLAIVVSAVGIDASLRAWVGTVHSGSLDHLASVGHWLGGGTLTLTLFLSLYVGGFLWRATRARRWGLLIGESYLFSGAITILVKSLLGRWRPYTEHGSLSFFPFTFGPNDHLSFPSGHVTVAFALASVVALMSENIAWRLAWFTLASITAFSRIYHDQHWLSDVLFSIASGTVVGVALVKASRRSAAPSAPETERELSK